MYAERRKRPASLNAEQLQQLNNIDINIDNVNQNQNKNENKTNQSKTKNIFKRKRDDDVTLQQQPNNDWSSHYIS